MARSAKSVAGGSSLPIVAAFVASAVFGAAHAATLAVGPVEQVNLKASTLTVLGQTYRIPATSAIRNQAGAVIGLDALAPDTIVAISGSESSNGSTKVTRVSSLPQLDVPGATKLFVTGVVSSENATGQIKVGKLVVDVTPTLTSDSQNFSVGSLVEITGTQPNPGGVFLAQNITATNGIIGSGAAAANGIIGSGAAANGIIGSGAAANGIIGSGAAANGIIGSGAAANGIIGSGAAANGIIGSGAATNGIIGSGAATNGIIGSGS